MPVIARHHPIRNRKYVCVCGEKKKKEEKKSLKKKKGRQELSFCALLAHFIIYYNRFFKIFKPRAHLLFLGCSLHLAHLKKKNGIFFEKECRKLIELLMKGRKRRRKDEIVTCERKREF